MRPERAERERPLPEQYAPNVKIGNNAKPRFRLLKIKPLGRVMKGEKKVSSMSCLNTNGARLLSRIGSVWLVFGFGVFFCWRWWCVRERECDKRFAHLFLTLSPDGLGRTTLSLSHSV